MQPGPDAHLPAPWPHRLLETSVLTLASLPPSLQGNASYKVAQKGVQQSSGNYLLFVSAALAMEPMALWVLGKPFATNLSGQDHHSYFDMFFKNHV